MEVAPVGGEADLVPGLDPDLARDGGDERAHALGGDVEDGLVAELLGERHRGGEPVAQGQMLRPDAQGEGGTVGSTAGIDRGVDLAAVAEAQADAGLGPRHHDAVEEVHARRSR